MVESPSVIGAVEPGNGRFNGNSGEDSRFRFKTFSDAFDNASDSAGISHR
jgi:hypothetical protein